MIQYYKTIQNTGLLLKHIIVRKFKGGTEWYLRNMKEVVFIYLATVKETHKAKANLVLLESNWE